MQVKNFKVNAVNHSKRQKMYYRNGWKLLNFLPHLITYMCLSNLMVHALLTTKDNSLDDSLVTTEQSNISHRQGRCKSMNSTSFKTVRFIQLYYNE